MIARSELSLSLAQRDPTGLPDRVKRAAVSRTTLSNETLPAWRNVRGRLSPVRFPLPPSPCQTNHMKRLTATIYLTLTVFLGSAGMSYGKKIEFNIDLICREISAKSFSVNGEIGNVKMDGEDLEVNIHGDFMTTRFLGLKSKDKFNNVVSFLHKDKNGKQILNSQFVANDGGER
jgi:hypothetical protein